MDGNAFSTLIGVARLQRICSPEQVGRFLERIIPALEPIQLVSLYANSTEWGRLYLAYTIGAIGAMHENLRQSVVYLLETDTQSGNPSLAETAADAMVLNKL